MAGTEKGRPEPIMRTNDSAWLQQGLNALALADPATVAHISKSHSRITVVDDPITVLRDEMPIMGFNEAHILASDVDSAYGVTVSSADPGRPTLIDGDIWLNRPSIKRDAEEEKVPVAVFLAAVIAHEWAHHNGAGEPPAYDAGIVVAEKLGYTHLADKFRRIKKRVADEARIREKFRNLPPAWSQPDYAY